jgi:hypothetical protein
MEIPKRDSLDPRWEELNKYFRGLADAMGLGQWYFTVSRDAPNGTTHNDEEAYASIQICSQSVNATLFVGNSFWTTEPYHQRWILVHELIHIVEAPYIKALEEVIDTTSSTATILHQLRERFVDQLALMLAPLYVEPPKDFMPDTPKEKT